MSKPGDTKVYPASCTSAYCGRIDCTGCRNFGALNDFKAWVKAHAAKQTDPVWCPSVWTATR